MGGPGMILDETHLASFSGAAHYTLQDLRTASRAVPLLRHAVENFGSSYTRAWALNLPEPTRSPGTSTPRSPSVIRPSMRSRHCTPPDL